MEGLQFVMYYFFLQYLCYETSQQQQQYICLKFNFLRKSFSFLKCHSTTSQKNKENKEKQQKKINKKITNEMRGQE